VFETFKSIISNKLIKSDNFNTKLCKNLKFNKTELTALYKQIKTANINRDPLL